MPDVIGMPWDFAKCLLYKSNIRYNAVKTYPTKDFFPLEEDGYYVIRQKCLKDDIWEITLAARLLKEVSRNGL